LVFIAKKPNKKMIMMDCKKRTLIKNNVKIK